MGARRVITVEKDENVYELARINSWSRPLKSENVDVVLLDVREFASEIDDNAFDVIIHDPPRISLAGELYSAEFYYELRRILKPGGHIVHYVGSPGSQRAKRIYVGVMKRMKEAGFRDESAECVYGYKASYYR